ncbi:MAG TPA: tRNA (guanosine(46)-N7)-methyltransferase TrmB [Chromatiaceae bacterium]|nr:tRNA (guanosine(46)-N7)-methyltransferase TrmB [Chromatiaceae bacterium]
MRSFVLRGGRLTKGQKRAFEHGWPRFGVDFKPEPLELGSLFGKNHPTWLEIGFGNGESLAAMAAAQPERNWLGIEVHPPGIGRLLMRIDELGLENVRIIRHDAVEVLEKMIPPASLSGMLLLFPDPWHKKRHHKRRIVQPAFVELVASRLEPGGVFHAASDWEPYAEWILQHFEARPDLWENLAGPARYAERPETRPLTKFEARGQRLGHPVRDLMFRRTAGPGAQ